MKVKFLAPVLLAGFLAFTACSKDDNNNTPNPAPAPAPNPNPQGPKDITIDATSGWKYFSFSQGKEITLTEPANSLDWDIAFNRYYVKLNGGASGKGQAEALKTDKVLFAEVTEAPKEGYAKDVEGEIGVGQGMPPATVKDTYSPVISGGIKGVNATGYVLINMRNMMTGQGDIYELTRHVYVVKTADGKKVKLQFTDYFNAKGQSKYPKFTYQIASEGDKF